MTWPGSSNRTELPVTGPAELNWWLPRNRAYSALPPSVLAVSTVGSPSERRRRQAPELFRLCRLAVKLADPMGPMVAVPLRESGPCTSPWTVNVSVCPFIAVL